MTLKVLLFTTILSHSLWGQSINRFKNFHGLKDPHGQGQFFEAEGYGIFIQNVDYALDEKGILKIRKKYSVRDSQLSVDSVLNIKTLRGSKEQSGVIARYSYYLIPIQKNKTTVGRIYSPQDKRYRFRTRFCSLLFNKSDS